MDEEEFWAYIETLSPEEQEQAMYDFGFAEANQVPGSFGESGMSPGLGYSEFDLGTYGQLPDELNKEGEVMPWGLDQEAQAYNALQDMGAMTVDNALAMYGGPGAYDAGSFEDIETPIGKPLDMSGQNYLDMMADSQSGWESYVAEKIRDEGMTPSAAVAAMWNFINMGGEGEVPEGYNEQRQALIESLPPAAAPEPGAGRQSQQNIGDMSTPQGRMATVDVGSVMDRANDLFERKASIPQVGYEDPKTGLPYAASRTEMSPTAERFAKAGIPTPNESYLDEEWLNAPLTQEDVEGRALREDQAQDRYGRAIEQTNDITGMQDELTRAWRDSLDERAAAIGREPQEPQVAQRAGGGAVLKSPDEAASERDRVIDKYMMEEAVRTGKTSLGPDEVLRARRHAGEELIGQRRQARLDGGREIEDMGTGEPWVIQSQGETGDADVLGTYDFGGTPEAQDAQARVATLMANFQNPGRKVTYGQMGPDTLRGVNRGVGLSRDARQAALDNQIRQHEMTSSSEASRAGAVGRAIAMQRAGRTPMNDILMQRAMARRTLMGR